MYTIEKIDLLKSDIRTAIQTWGENKIDQLCSAHPRLSTASIYIKRGLKIICLNLINKYQVM